MKIVADASRGIAKLSYIIERKLADASALCKR